MDAREPAKTEIAIVLLGSFNADLFHPAWFAMQGLIPAPEVEQAEVEIVHQQISQFRAGAFDIQVTPDRFFAGTTQDPYDALRDLVVGTFTMLQQTPIRAMGINRTARYEFASEEEWHALGHSLVPKRNWPFLKTPGLRELTEEGLRPDEHDGYVRVTVWPLPDAKSAVGVRVNDHFAWEVSDGDTAAEAVLAILMSEWRDSLERASRAISTIVAAP